MGSRKTGSITVFMSLMLMLIAALLFTLLEGSRYRMLGMAAAMNSQSVTESMFAEYNVPAYQNYHLLMMDSGYGTGELLLSKVNQRMQKLGQENLNPTVIGLGRHSNFLQMDVTDSSVVQYELATDQNAEALLKQMTQIMKMELVADLAEEAYRKITDVPESSEKGKKTDEYLDGAFDAMERAKEEAKEAAEGEAGKSEPMSYKMIGQQKGSSMQDTATGRCSMQDTGRCSMQHIQMRNMLNVKMCNMQRMGNSMQEAKIRGMHALEGTGMQEAVYRMVMETGNRAGPGHILRTETELEGPSDMSDSEIENPMEDIKSAKDSPLLAQILTSGDGVSTKQILKEDAVEKRTLNVGNYDGSTSIGVIDKMLIIQYLKKYTSNYLNKVSVPHALAYEQEYLLFGKFTDEDNLKKMASRILLVREGINFAYLMTDSAKCEEALAMATAIAIATGIPVAAEAIQMGILASWAYAESITELRTLFSGGKVSLVKAIDSWTVSLAEVATVPFNTSIKAKEVSGGIGYEDYLHAFLALESLTKIGSRFANLLEKNIRLYPGYEQVKLDCMVTAMETSHGYKAKQVFLTFVTIGRLSKKGYEYEKKYKFSYIDKKDYTS